MTGADPVLFDWQHLWQEPGPQDGETDSEDHRVWPQHCRCHCVHGQNSLDWEWPPKRSGC